MLEFASIILIASVSAAFAEVPHAALSAFPLQYGDGSKHERRLYTEYVCKADGKTVSIGPTCCEEIHLIQSRESPSFSTAADDKSCLDKNDWILNFEKYCSLASDGTMSCEYDIDKDNQACAASARAACSRNSGVSQTSDLTLQCGGDFTMTIKNHMDCLGYACSKHDIREYTLVSAQIYNHKFNSDSTHTCRITAINGVTISEMERQDKITGAITVVVMASLLMVFLYIRVKVCRRPQISAVPLRATTLSMAEVPTVHPPMRATGTNVVQMKAGATTNSTFDREFV